MEGLRSEFPFEGCRLLLAQDSDLLALLNCLLPPAWFTKELSWVRVFSAMARWSPARDPLFASGREARYGAKRTDY
jgi:hypothetical protein